MAVGSRKSVLQAASSQSWNMANASCSSSAVFVMISVGVTRNCPVANITSIGLQNSPSYVNLSSFNQSPE
jgi:hypothetical protein